MNKEQLKKLEKLRHKLDPEILKHVDESLNRSNNPPEKQPVDVDNNDPITMQLKALNKNIQKKEIGDKFAPEVLEHATEFAGFVVFTKSTLRRKIIKDYIEQMGHKSVSITSEPPEIMREVVKYIHDDRIRHTCIALLDTEFSQYETLLDSRAFTEIHNRVPELRNLPHIIFTNPNSNFDPLDAHESTCVLSLAHSANFNNKRLVRFLTATL